MCERSNIRVSGIHSMEPTEVGKTDLKRMVSKKEKEKKERE